MKKILILSTVLLIIISLFLINFLFHKKNTPFVTIDGKTFYVDVARTDLEKEKGLSIYKSLPLEKGMIFMFDSPNYYAFWMKNMQFPIDIIYIRQNKLVDIFTNLPPPKSPNEIPSIVKPTAPADTVLEINAGLSDKYNFKKGDLVVIKL